MSDPANLSRRQRQIMDVVFAQGEATVNQIAEQLPDAPTTMAVRRMMHVLSERGFLTRSKRGREVVYAPAKSQARAGVKALQHVLDTFFGSSLDEALAAHFSQRRKMKPEQLERIQELIADARKRGN